MASTLKLKPMRLESGECWQFKSIPLIIPNDYEFKPEDGTLVRINGMKPILYMYLLLTPSRGMLLVYKPSSLGRYAPSWVGIIKPETSRLGGVDYPCVARWFGATTSSAWFIWLILQSTYRIVVQMPNHDIMYQLALFRSPSDLYMYLAALPLSAMSRTARTPASEARVAEQSLSLSNLNWPQPDTEENNELKHLSNCSSSVFRTSFFRATRDTTPLARSLFHHFLSEPLVV